MRHLMWLLCAFAAPSFAQELTGYSGYVRQEDQTFWEDLTGQTLPNGGFERTQLTQSENRNIQFTIKDGQVTGALRSSASDTTYGHNYRVGTCLNGNVSPITDLGRARIETKASHSGPATCEANLGSGQLELSCGTEAIFSQTTTREIWGVSQSSCAEHDGTTLDSTSTMSDQDGYRTGVVIDVPDDALPAVISGSRTTELLNGWRTISWLLAKDGAYELMLSPEVGYVSWRSKAGANETTRGNALVVKATLKRRDGKPLDTSARQITFRLTQRSFEPGTMINFPPAAKRANPALPDLQFEAELNAPLGLEVRGDQGAEAVTTEGSYTEAYAYVSAFDWGAYGAVTAEALLPSGERVAARLAESAERELLIPKRASLEDPIAAVWRGAGSQRSGDALSDEDALPAGDGHAGDGLSLYEEYRGFQVNGQRVEGSPARKELFVRNKAGGYAIRGIARFAQRSGLRVHAQLAADELNELRDINFNSSGRFQRVRQHAVVVALITEDRGYAVAAGGPGTPGQIQAVEMPLDLYILNFPAGYADATLTHELGHAVNVFHHGETDPSDKRYRVVNGAVFESEADDLSLTEDGKTEVTLFNEDGTPIPLESIDVSRVARLGARQGQHSGDESCTMRYDVARFHVRGDPSQRFLNSSKEVVGSTFCSSSAGTGVNLQSRLPVSRYGDAAPGRGACAQQICVNDLHIHPLR